MTTVEQLQKLKNASRILRSATTEQKNIFLNKLAELINHNCDSILLGNEKDLAAAQNITAAMKKRLSLSVESISNIAKGVKIIADLPDPVGTIISRHQMPNGMEVGKTRTPIGVIFFVFESRPNVIVDAAALAIKSGNALLARGGKEAVNSNNIFTKIIQDALAFAGFPQDGMAQLEDKSHDAIYEVAQSSDLVDLVVARGREQLIKAVKEHARVPVIAHERGLCHIYVDEFADVNKAIKIIVNAKTSNPATCNSVESILINKNISSIILPKLIDALALKTVEIRGDTNVVEFDERVKLANSADWDTEFLSLTITMKIVNSLDEALAHIEQHGSRHSDAIVTENKINADKFIRQVNNAVALVNASTRLVDGSEFGLGAEFGISTSSIHMRGPMGLEDLTVSKYFVLGSGQIRE